MQPLTRLFCSLSLLSQRHGCSSGPPAMSRESLLSTLLCDQFLESERTGQGSCGQRVWARSCTRAVVQVHKYLEVEAHGQCWTSTQPSSVYWFRSCCTGQHHLSSPLRVGSRNFCALASLVGSLPLKAECSLSFGGVQFLQAGSAANLDVHLSLIISCTLKASDGTSTSHAWSQ